MIYLPDVKSEDFTDTVILTAPYTCFVWRICWSPDVGFSGEADRILELMTGSAKKGLFMNGIVNTGYGGAEHFYIDGKTCGYEGYLPESYNFLMAAFTRDPENRKKYLAFLNI